ncbi:hypothetical protein D9757_002612 [Collybiopsis confluens]|uniref:Methyltransferase domain-containing protein n=1 Tax=Collybiopsis confluens TaxID=2823264 RepID=A0A8H5HWB8_9AGAR|nr:hypothetical protein D9757_002612 [Collybiopsis confluens]
MPSLVFSESSSSSSMISSSSSLAVNAPSILSHSSGSGGSAKSIGPSSFSSPLSPSGFVYPSSRSLGRPAPGGPRFVLKSKKNRESGVEASRIPDENRYTFRSVPGITQAGSRLSMAGPSSILAPSLRPFSSSNPSTQASSSNSDFVFPTSRSRAHPRKFKKKKDNQLDEEINVISTKFMGISINRRKKNGPNKQFSAVPDSSPPAAAIPPDLATPVSSSFEQRLEPMQNASQVPLRLGFTPLILTIPHYSRSDDKSTYNLLRRLNKTGTPSFCLYENEPPSSVLDLGCSEGHWLLDAAIYWKGYGTQFTGLDIADTMKVIRPMALKHGVADNIRFARSNFLKGPLPFEDETFDLVRMSNLTFAISYDKWDFVLGEVCRVLTIGGRLEFIDDHIFFPYAKVVPSPSIDGTRLESRLPLPQEDVESNTYEPGDEDDGPHQPLRQTRRSSSRAMSSVETQFWMEQSGAAQELELLFERMMNRKFGIHLCPSEFLLEMMTEIFGHAREVKTVHLTIALPDYQLSDTNTFLLDVKEAPVTDSTRPPTLGRQTNLPNAPSLSDSDDHSLLNSPGLLLWPSTLLPVEPKELATHATRHPRTLLSCKAALSEYTAETLDIENDDMIKEALWEYEGFFASRLVSPSQVTETVKLPTSISSASVNTEHEVRARRRRQSVNSEFSIASDTRSAMWDYDFELRHHFAWPSNGSATTPTTPTGANPQSNPLQDDRRPFFGAPLSGMTREYIRERDSSVTNTITSRALHLSNAPQNPTGRESMPPVYSAAEPTHVRTFHVYEAIKIDPGFLSPI